MRLALAWGCPVKEAMGRCDADEFALWQAFYNLDPWGEQRADLRNALNCAVTAAPYMRRGRQARIEDYMPFKPPKPPQSMKELKAKMAHLRAFVKGLGKRGNVHR